MISIELVNTKAIMITVTNVFCRGEPCVRPALKLVREFPRQTLDYFR